ncbi:DUF6313 family protein [Streptomyces sp. R21]|uniref:DUF6313 family protein n=1 Tax=Streptomyces sp. R21 TaxID=3238627 RepID=A0AB39PM49_9ACTN
MYVSAPPPAPPPEIPPPRPNLGQQSAAWWTRRHALGRLPYWLLTDAVIALVLCATLYVTNGLMIGWTSAYEVLVGISSPADAKVPWIAWPLSLLGWAALPAFIGGAAGYLITVQIESHQSRDFDAVVAELRTLAQSPTDPGDEM